MQTKITNKLKNIIATLVCVMMVAGTFPVHALNDSVFAGNEVVYADQSGVVSDAVDGDQLDPVQKVVENIEGEDIESGIVNEKLVESDDLNEKSAESDQINSEKAVETADDVQDVKMEGGEGKVHTVSNPKDLKDVVNNKAKDGDTIQLNKDIKVTNNEGYALTVTGKKIKITSNDPNQPRTISCTGKGKLLGIEGKDSIV